MKKLLWTSAMALTAAACMTACDDSSSGASNSIPEFKTEAALPDTCEMEVAKVDTAYFACFENKWIEVTDSATVEQFKEGLDEDEVKAKLEELEDLLKPVTPAKPKSSSSKNTDEDVESSDSDEPESSASEEECTGRRCKTGNSSSSKKSSGGSGSGDSGEGGGSSPSSTDSSDDSSPSSTDSSGDSSPSSATSGTSESASSTESKCGTKTYDPSTQWCRTTDNTVIAIANTECCNSPKSCHYSSRETYPEDYYDKTKEFCDSRTNAYQIYKMVTIGTQTWMAENLNYETTTGSSCYNDAASCSGLGRLYTLSAADESVCPNGWHLPNNTEWELLKKNAGGDAEAAQNLKAYSSGWDEAFGTDKYGFAAEPAGIYDGKKYTGKTVMTAYWSSTIIDEMGDMTYYHFTITDEDEAKITTVYTNISIEEYPNRYSVRCIKD